MARPTRVRHAILDLLASSERHGWTIEDVGAALSQRGTPADPSSVFRGLTRLSDEGILTEVQLGDGKARFEAVRDHHEHIHCSECGTVAAVPGCLVDQADPHVERTTGFRVTGHRLVYTGVCPGCSHRGA